MVSYLPFYLNQLLLILQRNLHITHQHNKQINALTELEERCHRQCSGIPDRGYVLSEFDYEVCIQLQTSCCYVPVCVFEAWWQRLACTYQPTGV